MGYMEIESFLQIKLNEGYTEIAFGGSGEKINSVKIVSFLQF